MVCCCGVVVVLMVLWWCCGVLWCVCFCLFVCWLVGWLVVVVVCHVRVVHLFTPFYRVWSDDCVSARRAASKADYTCTTHLSPSQASCTRRFKHCHYTSSKPMHLHTGTPNFKSPHAVIFFCAVVQRREVTRCCTSIIETMCLVLVPATSSSTCCTLC